MSAKPVPSAPISAKPPPSDRPSAPVEARTRSTIPPAFAAELASEVPTESFLAAAAQAEETPPPPTVGRGAAGNETVGLADRAAIEAADPERKKARKLARLLISEIKLYNEKLTAEGLAASDVYTRLKDPIDQSLVLFERRVPEAIRAEFDYVHDELVRQLAGGDASKLGPDYQRARRN